MQRLSSPEGQLTDVEFSSALYEWPLSATNKEQVWVRCNMVMTQDGAAVGSDGRSATIATPIDMQAFGVLRRDSDVILVGAGTARAERYRPAAVPIALVSQHLALHHDLPLFAQRQPESPTTILLTTAKAIASAPEWLNSSSELVACGEEQVDLALALQALQLRGLTRVHSEGGPSLLTSLVQAQLLDELLLTITPMIQGATKSLIGNLDAPVYGSISQVLIEDGTILLRFLPDYSKA
ncbi:MAG: dihydrofolate reductase family protein [Actinomycetota bacterium]|nr:dihydrofolate reductase family protein [Actinomycetota bacterium]